MFFCYDLLELNGEDYREQTLTQRRIILPKKL